MTCPSIALVGMLLFGMLAAPLAADAQTARTYRVAYVNPGAPTDEH